MREFTRPEAVYIGRIAEGHTITRGGFVLDHTVRADTALLAVASDLEAGLHEPEPDVYTHADGGVYHRIHFPDGVHVECLRTGQWVEGCVAYRSESGGPLCITDSLRFDLRFHHGRMSHAEAHGRSVCFELELDPDELVPGMYDDSRGCPSQDGLLDGQPAQYRWRTHIPETTT